MEFIENDSKGPKAPNFDWNKLKQENLKLVRMSNKNAKFPTVEVQRQKVSVNSHQVYDPTSKTWETKQASQHPVMDFKVKSTKPGAKTATWTSMPDTGAQVSMASKNLLRTLKLDFHNDCEETDIRISGVGKGIIDQETRTLKLWIQNPKTKSWAAEMIYISDGHELSLLSYDCILNLGMISKDSLNSDTAEVHNASTRAKPAGKGLCRSTQKIHEGKIICSCPKWESKVKGPKTEDRDAYLKKLQSKYGDNPKEDDLTIIREKLSEFLKNEFSGMAFNQCETQSLHTMKVTKMKVNLKPGAKPVNFSKTYVVPINLKEKVK
jgi:hypothetical protein